jgi:hypothetical protein
MYDLYDSSYSGGYGSSSDSGFDWSSLLGGVLAGAASGLTSSKTSSTPVNPYINPVTGLPYSTTPAAAASAVTGTSTLLMYGGLALVGFMLLKKFKLF